MLYSFCLFALLSATTSPPTGEIALLVGTEQEDLQVCLFSFTDHSLTPIGPGERDSSPRWSPDGMQIAFSTWHQEQGGLGISCYAMATKQLTQLTHQRTWCTAPRWSPDGNRIAYTTEHRDARRTVTVFDLQTKTETYWAEELQENSGIKGFLRPVWLSDLNSLNYLHADETNWPPFAIEAEKHGVILALAIVQQGEVLSTEPYALTPSHALPLLPLLSKDSHRYFEWCIEASPTGHIAFESNDGGDREIYSLRQHDIANLSNHRAADWQPTWAHAGRYMLFESFRNGSRGIFHLDARTGRTTPVVAATDHNQWSPAWSPDDQWFVFIADQSGHTELYLSDLQGESRQQLTQENKLIFAPAWKPAPKEEN